MSAFKRPSESELQSLAAGLGSADPAVRSIARRELAGAGPEAARFLRTHATGASPNLRAAIWGVLQELGEQFYLEQLHTFAGNQTSLSLERAALALSGLDSPLLDSDAYVKRLESFADDLRLLLGPPDQVQHNLDAFTTFMAGELGLHGGLEDYHDPENSFLDRTIDRRTGLPISLSAVYMVVGRSAGLQIGGIGLPGHFVVSFGPPQDAIFLDPYSGGVQLNRRDCEALVERTGLPFVEAFLLPVSNGQMLRRMCRNLVNAYSLRHDAPRARRYGEIELLFTA